MDNVSKIIKLRASICNQCKVNFTPYDEHKDRKNNFDVLDLLLERAGITKKQLSKKTRISMFKLDCLHPVEGENFLTDAEWSRLAQCLGFGVGGFKYKTDFFGYTTKPADFLVTVQGRRIAKFLFTHWGIKVIPVIKQNRYRTSYDAGGCRFWFEMVDKPRSICACWKVSTVVKQLRAKDVEVVVYPEVYSKMDLEIDFIHADKIKDMTDWDKRDFLQRITNTSKIHVKEPSKG